MLLSCIEQSSWLFLNSELTPGWDWSAAACATFRCHCPTISWCCVRCGSCTSGATPLECLMYEIQCCRWEGTSGSYLIQALAEDSNHVKVASGSTCLCVAEFWEKIICMEITQVFWAPVLVISWKVTNSSSRLFPWLWMLLYPQAQQL